MQPSEELFAIARSLEGLASLGDEASSKRPLQALETAVDMIKRSFSGSWLGYHSRVYYEGLRPAPPGAHFSQEFGLEDLSFVDLGSRGDWVEHDFEYVKRYIFKQAGNPDLTTVRNRAADAAVKFGEAKAEIASILETELADSPDQFLTKLKVELEKLEPVSKAEVAQLLSPKGQIMTRDMVAMGQGTKVPAHVDVGSDVLSIQHSFGICKAAADLAKKAASHIERKNKRKVLAGRVGTNVFIGHGRSMAWRELKDFVQDRLQLPWDEFNRVPVAGITNIARLSEMLDAAAVALLVMTAEDEMTDGVMQARMNVVHEAGLFQGRLGFTKAIVLVEEGCTEFSNIQGLGQIRFPKGNIGAAFEEIRRVLEREGLLDSSS